MKEVTEFAEDDGEEEDNKRDGESKGCVKVIEGGVPEVPTANVCGEKNGEGEVEAKRKREGEEDEFERRIGGESVDEMSVRQVVMDGNGKRRSCRI